MQFFRILKTRLIFDWIYLYTLYSYLSSKNNILKIANNIYNQFSYSHYPNYLSDTSMSSSALMQHVHFSQSEKRKLRNTLTQYIVLKGKAL